VTLVSVQAFGITAPGGGPRILRALFEGADAAVQNVCTSTSEPPRASPFAEAWIPARPAFGPLERTRAGGPLGALETVLARRLERRIAELCERSGATAVHSVAHSSDVWPAFQAARRLGLPFALTVHDDMRYVLRTRPDRALALRRLGEAWEAADHRFVIGTAIGEEYSARYGRRPYEIVTDGLEDDEIAARPAETEGLRMYFAGLFHRAYTDNVRQFATAMRSLAATRGLPATARFRCGKVPVELDAEALGLTVLPFAAEDVVRDDLTAADFAYMPLPFGEGYRDFFRYSVSTKMVKYLGSGKPIVYHGPAEGAAYEILAEHDAAILVHSLDTGDVARALEDGLDRAGEIAANGLALARRSFRIADQRSRFWQAFAAPLSSAPSLVA
jgi:glycosyltransferase involved in cell wall biosynthesis